jgi:hypothetical protein
MITIKPRIIATGATGKTRTQRKSGFETGMRLIRRESLLRAFSLFLCVPEVQPNSY